jgi:hypothetical protein
MPYFDEPILSKTLPDDSFKVWRYVDFAKFLDLLFRQEQFFVSGKKLRETDPHEGFFTIDDLFNDFQQYPEIHNEIKRIAEETHSENLYINCWHINDTDSDAMWKLYSQTDRGVAIQSTLKKLKSSFQDEPQRVDITKVRYVDYSNAKISNKNIIDMFSAKQNSYKHEEELRVFVFNVAMIHDKIFEVNGQKFEFHAHDENRYQPIRGENGIYVKTKITELIEKIYVSPRAPSWFVDLVKSMVKTYGIDDNLVEQSKLYKKP